LDFLLLGVDRGDLEFTYNLKKYYWSSNNSFLEVFLDKIFKLTGFSLLSVDGTDSL